MHEFDRLTELQLGSPQSGTSLLEKLLGSLWQELPDRSGCPSRFAACVCVFYQRKRGLLSTGFVMICGGRLCGFS